MNDHMARITIDPEICHGKPCVRGLRYPVETILELLSGGTTIEDLLADYEDLEREDVFAVLAFAAHARNCISAGSFAAINERLHKEVCTL